MASNGVRFATADARPLYDVLTCIRQGVTLEQAGQRLSSNAERYLKPPELMARLFSDLPQALAGTEALAERLDFTLANLGYRFPDYPVPDGGSQASFLRQLAQVGARPVSAAHDRASGPDRARARSHRKARTGRLLSHCLGHREFLPAAGHSRAGQRVGGQ
jgi:error-prone DNA polymerase